MEALEAVSYTHLDAYKRQGHRQNNILKQHEVKQRTNTLKVIK